MNNSPFLSFANVPQSTEHQHQLSIMSKCPDDNIKKITEKKKNTSQPMPESNKTNNEAIKNDKTQNQAAKNSASLAIIYSVGKTMTNGRKAKKKKTK